MKTEYTCQVDASHYTERGDILYDFVKLGL